MTFETR